MNEATPIADNTPRGAWWQLVALLVLCLVFFRSEVGWCFHFASVNGEGAHWFAAPFLLAVLTWKRRHVLASSAGSGTALGLIPIVLAIVVAALCQWPFNYGLPQRLALIPALAGSILVITGWRYLWHALPLLLFLTISIPIGPRYYEFLSADIEMLTLKGMRIMVEVFPGVDMASLSGGDLLFYAGDKTGSIAMVEPHRGATLLFGSLSIALFVIFQAVRPVRHLAMLAVAVIPIIIVSNALRLFTWAVAGVYTNADPVAGTPRIVATVVSILCAYLLTIAMCGIVSWLMPTEKTS